MNNSKENIDSIRLLDGVAQYNTGANNVWKPFINSVEDVTSGFRVELYHVGKYIRVNSATDVIVTVRDLEFPVGSSITFEQTGTGTITMSGSGVTLNGELTSIGQYKVIQIIKVASKTWTVLGGTTV